MTLRRVRVRRGTAASWTSANPTLGMAEFGFETDSKKMKMGDGATNWNTLPYWYEPGAGGTLPADVLRSTTDNVVMYAENNALVGASYVVPGFYRRNGSSWVFEEALSNAMVSRTRTTLPYTLTYADVKGGNMDLNPASNGVLTLPLNLFSGAAPAGALAWLPFSLYLLTGVTVTLQAATGVSLFVEGQSAAQSTITMTGPNARIAFMHRTSQYRQM